jgi:hypothetical protein
VIGKLYHLGDALPGLCRRLRFPLAQSSVEFLRQSVHEWVSCFRPEFNAQAMVNESRLVGLSESTCGASRIVSFLGIAPPIKIRTR